MVDFVDELTTLLTCRLIERSDRKAVGDSGLWYGEGLDDWRIDSGRHFNESLNIQDRSGWHARRFAMG